MPLTPQTALGFSTAALSPPLFFRDPYACALAAGAHLDYFRSPAQGSVRPGARLELLAGMAHSRDSHFEDSPLLLPGIFIGARLPLYSDDNRTASAAFWTGYRQYLRLIGFNNENPELYARPVAAAAAEIRLMRPRGFYSCLGGEYDLTFDAGLRHSLAVFVRFGVELR